MNDAFGAGRGYAVASGVASAIEACVKEYYPGTDIKIDHVEGLAECPQDCCFRQKAGKKNGYLIEGMGCPGGCVAGAGTNIPVNKANVQVKKFVKRSRGLCSAGDSKILGSGRSREYTKEKKGNSLAGLFLFSSGIFWRKRYKIRDRKRIWNYDLRILRI